MLIEVSRSGGVAGMTRRAVIDTDAREDAEEWVALASTVRGVPPAAATSGMADAFTWSIRVDTEHAVVPDGALTGPLRELAERALREGRPPPR